MKLIFATNNAHKLQELRRMAPAEMQIVSLREAGIDAELPETQSTLEGNALQKARAVYALTGCDCVADDTGLEVDALGGAPGVHSARYATDGHDSEANMRKLLREMQGAADRRARFRTVMALIIGGEEYTFEGSVEGTIATAPAGDGGFGYDPLFVPQGWIKTFAQAAPDEKNAISHRGRACQRLAQFLAHKK